MKEALSTLMNQLISLPGKVVGIAEALLDSLKTMATGPGSVLKILAVMVGLDLVMLGKLGLNAHLIAMGTGLYTTLAANTTAMWAVVILAVIYFARKP